MNQRIRRKKEKQRARAEAFLAGLVAVAAAARRLEQALRCQANATRAVTASLRALR